MKPPLFWSRPPQTPGWQACALWPLTLLWRTASNRRWRRGDHARMPVPVICVGNINMGGVGKTPTVIALLSMLEDMGAAPHVISRGYGGSQTGPLRVDPARHVADDVGDEPLLLAAFAPTWVAKDRAAGAQAALDAGAGCLVLDDGMQNPALAKDLVIMVVDAAQGFGNGQLVPAGPLRQSVDEGLARADLMLLVGSPEARSRFRSEWPQVSGLPLAQAEIRPLRTGMDWQGLRVFAFAGIGRPEKFFATLDAVGADIVATRSFGDHATIPEALLTRMANEAQSAGAQLVTTEKDAVRLPRRWQQEVLTLPVRMDIADEQTVLAALKAAVGGKG